MLGSPGTERPPLPRLSRSARHTGELSAWATTTALWPGRGWIDGSMSGIRFPGESDEYRAARNELLEAEIALRKQVETVAALRRRLPPGGAVEDYTFEQMTEDGEVGVVHLSEPGQPSLFIYSYMYGPDWEAPCPLCTSFLDGLDRYAVHIEQRLPVVAVAKAPPEMLRSVSRARGWANLRLLSAANGSYSVDYHAESPDGSQYPIANVFTRGPDGIRQLLVVAAAVRAHRGAPATRRPSMADLALLRPDARGPRHRLAPEPSLRQVVTRRAPKPTGGRV